MKARDSISISLKGGVAKKKGLKGLSEMLGLKQRQSRTLKQMDDQEAAEKLKQQEIGKKRRYIRGRLCV